MPNHSFNTGSSLAIYPNMPQQVDEKFYDRADALIHLANAQLSATTGGTVSASFMYAASRFNAWRSACGFEKKEEMEAARDASPKTLTTTSRTSIGT
jgi:hypothetical protein